MVRFCVFAFSCASLIASCGFEGGEAGAAGSIPGSSVGSHTWKVDPVSGITGGRDLFSVSLNASGDIGFAIGDEGLVLRWDGRQWRADADAMAVAKGGLLLAVAVDSTGNRALAVGASGLVMSWNGKTWKRESTAEKLARGRSLFALDFDNKGRTAWVVGQYGVALHWNGAKWTRTPTPFTPPGRVEGGAPVDSFGMWAVWIEPNGVDATATGNGNRILRWDGRTWKDDSRAPNLRVPGDGFSGIGSIAVSKDGTRGWMIGSESTTLTRSGSKWQKMPPKPPPSRKNPDYDGYLVSVACDGAGSTAFAVGLQGMVERWDGTTWVLDPSGRSAAAGRSLNEVALSENGNVGFAVGQKGLLLRWDGKEWKRDPAGERASYGDFSSVAMSADGKNGFAVCYNGTPLQWDGTTWKADGSSRPGYMRLGEIWMSPAGDRAFGAGEDGIFEWNGSEWSARPSSRSIHTMALSEDAQLGFTGNVFGKIYRYDGSQWSEDKQGSQEAGGKPLSAMYLSPDGKLGFAGGSGSFLQWDGSAWHKDPKLSEWSSFYTICLSKKRDIGFAIGSGPLGESVLRWDGKGWSIDRQASKIFNDTGPYRMALSDDGRTGIAVSFQGPVLLWDGTKWSKDTLASSLAAGQRPVSVCLDPKGKSGWVLGWKGFLMRFQAAVTPGTSRE